MIAALLVMLLLGLLVILSKKTNAECESKKRLDGKTVLVTGGTAGMGLEIATEMARRGARVIVACPFPKEGASALDLIVRSTGNHNVVFQQLDLASFASVRCFATDILENEPRLDILINNAGIGGSPIRNTVDGLNVIMQVNYYGLFLLTLLLLPILKKSGRPGEPSRILNTASMLHFLGFVDIHNLDRANNYLETKYYCDSKFCVVLFTKELAKKLQEKDCNVVVNTVDPGLVGTRIFDTWNSLFGRVISLVFFCIFKSPWQGAQTALHVALDETAAVVSGEYFWNCHQSWATSRANDELARKVWEESIKIVKL